MKQTTKTENVNYLAPDAQAIITMANLMDMLIVHINMHRALQQAKSEGYTQNDVAVPQFIKDMHGIDSFDKERVYNLLTEMGFIPTGKIDILPKGYEFIDVVAAQMEAEHIAKNPDTGDNLPESEKAMKQAEIASKALTKDRELPNYRVELEAIDIPKKYIKDLAQNITKVFEPILEGDGTCSKIEKGLFASNENNAYVMRGLFYETACRIEEIVIEYCTTRNFYVKVTLKDKNGKAFTSVN